MSDIVFHDLSLEGANGKKKFFVDIIPDLAKYIGVGTLEYLPVAVKHAEDYNYPEFADWFARAYKRLHKAVQEEWNAEEWMADGDAA